MTNHTKKKLGLVPLTALIIGSMIGGGVFALPQNLAAHSSVGAIIIGWLITAVGIIALATVFKYLSETRPALKNGIYSYAKAGFGAYMGFNSAWGYWLSALFGNVSYAVLMFTALGYFFPLFKDGNSLSALIGASIMLWGFHWVVSQGVREAAMLNVITTAAKLIPIFIFLVIAAFAFNINTLRYDFWGTDLADISTQVKNTMLVTLWVFVGIEGAVVESARVKRQADISKATYIGLFGTLIVYVLISLLSLGILPQAELAGVKNPSMAIVLEHILGPWGAILVNTGLVISLLGAWLSWTLLCIQLPYDLAIDHAMPKIIAQSNSKGVPIGALWLTNIIIQLSLIFTFFFQSSYLLIFKFAASCILIPYLMSSFYALKVIIQTYLADKQPLKYFYLISILLSCLYSVWLIYAAGMYYLSLSTIVYILGLGLYVWTKKDLKPIFFGL